MAISKAQTWETYEDWSSAGLLDGRIPMRREVTYGEEPASKQGELNGEQSMRPDFEQWLMATAKKWVKGWLNKDPHWAKKYLDLSA